MTEFKQPEELEEQDLLIRTLMGEARGESLLGQLAVEEVIWNRVSNPRWWGDGLKEVILKPFQYSCWNRNDPNRSFLLNPGIVDTAQYKRIKALIEAYGYQQRYGISLTDNSDHYLVSAIADRVSWAVPEKETMRIGRHTFYRLELPSIIEWKLTDALRSKAMPVHEGYIIDKGVIDVDGGQPEEPSD